MSGTMNEFAEAEKAILGQVSPVTWPDAPPGVCEPDREIPCDICGSERNIELWPKKNFSQSVRTVICEDCGLVFTNPQPDCYPLYKLGRNYERYRMYGNWQRYLEMMKSWKIQEPMAQTWAQHLNIGKGTRVLDFGSGNTGIGGLIAEKLDARVVGCDLDPFAVEYSQKHWPKAEYFVGSYEDCAGEYDAIILNQVLEHMQSPKTTLLKLRELLVGRIGIAVPSIDNPDDWYSGPTPPVDGLDRVLRKTHLYNFSVNSMRNLLGICGLELRYYFFDDDGGKQGNGCSMVTVAVRTDKPFTIVPENAHETRERLLKWDKERRECLK